MIWEFKGASQLMSSESSLLGLRKEMEIINTAKQTLKDDLAIGFKYLKNRDFHVSAA